MRLNDCAVLLRALSVWIVATAGALQVSTANQSISNPGIAGAKLESVSLDESGRVATVRIRNLSDTDITAFDLVIQTTSAEKHPTAADFSFRLRDLIFGIQSGVAEAIHPGSTYDEVVNVTSKNLKIDLDVVVYSDATAEFSNREIFLGIMAQRQAATEAAKQTEEIVRSSASKADALYRLTTLWEQSKADRPLMTPLLANHLYNLRIQKANSEADQQRMMLDYADERRKEAQFFSFHANLQRRAQ
jgi:hypothetical protein